MRCHWHRMHGACGIIDTGCMVHAVSLTHAQYNFRTTSKSENHMQNGYAMQQQKMHAVSLTPYASVHDAQHAPCTVPIFLLVTHEAECITCIAAKCDTPCTIDERFERPWQPLKGISIKNIHVPQLSYPTTAKIKYINLKRLPKKKFSCMRCHWNRMRSKIGEFETEFKGGFSLWIRGPGCIVWWKKEGRKSRDTVPLSCLFFWYFLSHFSK
jgi:hypothetical protein